MMTAILALFTPHLSKFIPGGATAVTYLAGVYFLDGFLGGTVSTIAAAAVGYGVNTFMESK